jgi:hypothetical protein
VPRINPESPGFPPIIWTPGHSLEATIFRISRSGSNEITDVAQLDEIEQGIRASTPERYHVGEIEQDPLTSGHTIRRWGFGVKRADQTVAIVPAVLGTRQPRTLPTSLSAFRAWPVLVSEPRHPDR